MYYYIALKKNKNNTIVFDRRGDSYVVVDQGTGRRFMMKKSKIMDTLNECLNATWKEDKNGEYKLVKCGISKKLPQYFSKYRKEKVRDWYMLMFPSDELGERIDPKLTFGKVFDGINDGIDMYAMTGVSDSLVRERIEERVVNMLYLDDTIATCLQLQEGIESNRVDVRNQLYRHMYDRYEWDKIFEKLYLF